MDAGNMPEYEKPGPPKGEAYGAAAVTQALSGFDFPASKQDLMNARGDREIEIEKGRSMKLRDLLQRVSKDNFDSMADVVSALRNVI
ncbi:MAG: DUF2795 domain-containing protein [bacterium]|nr:DUF2795 domain-containing protein [bacterium]